MRHGLWCLDTTPLLVFCGQPMLIFMGKIGKIRIKAFKLRALMRIFVCRSSNSLYEKV